jgi:hypothetical protein
VAVENRSYLRFLHNVATRFCLVLLRVSTDRTAEIKKAGPRPFKALQPITN